MPPPDSPHTPNTVSTSPEEAAAPATSPPPLSESDHASALKAPRLRAIRWPLVLLFTLLCFIAAGAGLFIWHKTQTPEAASANAALPAPRTPPVPLPSATSVTEDARDVPSRYSDFRLPPPLAESLPALSVRQNALEGEVRRMDQTLDGLRAQIETNDAQKSMQIALDHLLDTVDTLPFAYDRRPAADVAPAAVSAGESGVIRRTWEAIKQELAQWVRIEYEETATPGKAVPLTRLETRLLRGELRQYLLAVRLALHSHDAVLRGISCRHSRQLLDQYFDGQNAGVREAVALLARINEAGLPAAVTPAHAS